jgi:hypothetical protein
MDSARIWARAAVIGIVLYVAIDVTLVFLRPELSVLHSAESDYDSTGHYGWLKDLNFLVRCLLSLAVVRALMLAVGTSGRMGLALGLITTWALASALLALFPDDPVGTVQHLHGRIHLLLALLAFAAILVGTIVASRALRTVDAWRPVHRLLLVLSWGALLPVLLLGRVHLRRHSLGGLYEKLFLLAELAWLLVVALWIAQGGGTGE